MDYSPSIGRFMGVIGMEFKDRGDPAVPDFTKGDLVIDEAWHELDLSSVIPTSTNLIFIKKINFERDLGPGHLEFRAPGNVNELNLVKSSNALDDFYVMTVNGKVDYKVIGDEPNWVAIDFIIRGWLED